MQTHLRAFLGSRCRWGPCFVSPARWLLGWETATGFGEVMGECYCIWMGCVWDHVIWCFKWKMFSRAYLTAYLKELSRFCNWPPKSRTPHPNSDSIAQHRHLGGANTGGSSPTFSLLFGQALNSVPTACLAHFVCNPPFGTSSELVGGCAPKPPLSFLG